MSTTVDKDLQQLAEHAVEHNLHDGMRVGLGTGRTLTLFLHALAQRQNQFRRCTFYASSEATLQTCSTLGIPISPMQTLPDQHTPIDITIDGADQIDEQGVMIKGGGGALLREKILAGASKEYLILIAREKRVTTLSFPLPVEVPIYAGSIARRFLADACNTKEIILRQGTSIAGPARSEQNAIILDVHYANIPDAHGLAARLSQHPSVLAHGLFVERDYRYIWSEAGDIHEELVSNAARDPAGS